MLLKKTVVLVGMMGAGKTAVGRAVAAQLDVPFLDSDEQIVKAANMSISEIFERDGESFFRDAEHKVISRLLGDVPSIISTGGGAFLQDRNREIISKRGASVCIAADVELLWSRVKSKDTRPLLKTENPKATLQELYAQRAPVYALADITVQSQPEFTIAETCSAVIEALKSRDDVLYEKKAAKNG